MGDKINCDFSNSSGTLVLEPSENSKLFNNVTRPIRLCIIPKRKPIQFLGPSPKGNHVIASRLLVSSLLKRSGLNCSGLG